MILCCWHSGKWVGHALHGPVSATVQAPTAVTLSGISASPAAASAALPWLLVVAGAGLALTAARRRR